MACIKSREKSRTYKIGEGTGEAYESLFKGLVAQWPKRSAAAFRICNIQDHKKGEVRIEKEEIKTSVESTKLKRLQKTGCAP